MTNVENRPFQPFQGRGAISKLILLIGTNISSPSAPQPPGQRDEIDHDRDRHSRTTPRPFVASKLFLADCSKAAVCR